MKLAVAHAVFYFCCLSSSLATCSGADLNSSWQSLGQAKVNKKSKTAVPFRPELTLEENNQLLNQHRAKSVIVSSTIPLANVSVSQLLNRSVRWQLDSQTFSGRVTAVSLSGDQQHLTIFAEISAADLKSQQLNSNSSGLLSIEG